MIYTRRCTEYQELVDESWKQGWKTGCALLDVGCQQRPAGRLLCKGFTTLGLTREAKRNAIASAPEDAEKDARWRWMKRKRCWDRGIEGQRDRGQGLINRYGCLGTCVMSEDPLTPVAWLMMSPSTHS